MGVTMWVTTSATYIWVTKVELEENRTVRGDMFVIGTFPFSLKGHNSFVFTPTTLKAVFLCSYCSCISFQYTMWYGSWFLSLENLMRKKTTNSVVMVEWQAAVVEGGTSQNDKQSQGSWEQRNARPRTQSSRCSWSIRKLQHDLNHLKMKNEPFLREWLNFSPEITMGPCITVSDPASDLE